MGNLSGSRHLRTCVYGFLLRIILLTLVLSSFFIFYVPCHAFASSTASDIYQGYRDWKWPVTNYSRISSCYLDLEGHAGGHYALDIPAPEGTPVYASLDGVVISTVNTGCPHSDSCECGGGLGNAVYIRYSYLGTEFVGRYGHLYSIDVVSGQKVNEHTIIGRVGTTGRSTGNHLDFKI